jgi:hypothetical protein
MVRFVIASLIVWRIVFASETSYADEARVLAQLKSTNVDWLSFGMASLEAHLRLHVLEICRLATDCGEEEISVAYADHAPQE